jgi:hypothetical protein
MAANQEGARAKTDAFAKYVAAEQHAFDHLCANGKPARASSARTAFAR